MRREDAEDPVILGTKDTTVDEALVEPAPCVLPETRHDTLRLLAFMLLHDGQSLVQQTVARGTGVPDHQPALAHTLVGARDVDPLHQSELHQEGAAERHVHLGAERCQLSGVVVRQQEQEVLGEEHGLMLGESDYWRFPQDRSPQDSVHAAGCPRRAAIRLIQRRSR